MLAWARRNRPSQAAEAALLGTVAVALGVAISTTISAPGDFTTYLTSTRSWAQLGPASLTYSNAALLWPPLNYLLLWPLTLIPYHAAVTLWAIASCLAALLAWRLGSGRPLQLALVLVGPASVAGFVLGQIDFLVIAAIVGSWWLIKNEHPWLGGAVLALATVKPNLMFAVPLVLAAAGRWRPLAAFAAGCGIHLIVGVAMFGPHLLDLVRHWAAAGGSQLAFFVEPQSVVRGIFPGIAGYVVTAAGIALAVCVAWWRRRSIDAVFAAGLLGSLFGNPYLHTPDLIAFLPAWWWMAGESAPRRWVFGATAAAGVATLVGASMVPWMRPWLTGNFAHALNLLPASAVIGLVMLAPAPAQRRQEAPPSWAAQPSSPAATD